MFKPALAAALALGLAVPIAARSQPAPAAPAGPTAPAANVVVHNSLSGHGARSILEAAFREAHKAGFSMSIAVVDDAGDLLAFQRMDAAPRGTIAVAEGKARTAARFKMPTAAIGEMVAKVGLNMLTTPDMVSLGGGAPILIDGKIVGAIGVSGGNGPQDLQVVKAGLTVVAP